MRIFTTLAAAALLATPALTAPCRDAKGHFVKCPPVVTHTTTTTTVSKTHRCRDAHGRFTACPK